METRLPPSPRGLFYLPDELLVHVASHLANDKPTLCALARTCRFFQAECEKHIYATIELLCTSDLRAMIEAFTHRTDRIASVETLKILYQFHDGLGATAEERHVFNQCVAGMKGLRNWHVESPYDNYKWNEGGGDEWVLRDMEEFRKALESASLQAGLAGTLTAPPGVGLSKLERLVLHTHGVDEDFWNLGGFHCLFRHPSLRYLHVSCVVLPADLPELEPYANSTPLAELVFDECELEPKSLARILAVPKSLRRLTLGENVFNINLRRRPNPRLTRSPQVTLAALKHVAHSLESLTHYDPTWSVADYHSEPVPISGDGMRHFHNLKSLQVDTCSFLHRSIALSHTQAPPNLACLRIRNPCPRFSRLGYSGSHDQDFFARLPSYEPYTYLASLKTLEFVQGASSQMEMATLIHMTEDEFVRERHACAYKLFKHGINLKVSLEAIWRESMLPPFLYREPPPELICVYDAAQVGFRRHTAASREHALRAQLQNGTPSETGTSLLYSDPAKDQNSGVFTSSGTSTKTESLPETDQLTTSDIFYLRSQVKHSVNAMWNRMREKDPQASDSDSDVAVFTVLVDPDGEEWEVADEDDDDEDLDDDWHDAEEYDVEDDLDLGLGGMDEDEELVLVTTAAAMAHQQTMTMATVAAAVLDEEDEALGGDGVD